MPGAGTLVPQTERCPPRHHEGGTVALNCLAGCSSPLGGTASLAVRGTTQRTALVFLSGEQSHAFGTSTAGKVTAADLDFELWDLGYAALDGACLQAGITRAELLYARVDLTGGTEAPSLRDLDLIAPDLGWRHLDDDTRALQQRTFALGVESACERMGLGPLSHRGP